MANNQLGDFHLHTTYSDGTLTPLELLESVKAKHLTSFAITDHDTLKGSLALRPFLKLDDPILITGVEISTFLHNESVHILGYFKENCDLTVLNETFDTVHRARIQRAETMNGLLKEHFNISFDCEALKNRPVLTRGTIAQALMERYPTLGRERIFKEMIGDGCPAFVAASTLTPLSAIQLIHQAGGYAVLAHPGLLKKNKAEDIIHLGLDGLEALYPSHRQEEVHNFKNLAKRYHLFYTAGSDYHGPQISSQDNHGSLGSVVLSNQPLERFLACF